MTVGASLRRGLINHMTKYKHPQHGYHIPLNSTEEASMLKNGWVIDEPAEEPTEEAGQALPSEPAPIKRGPGRPKKVVEQ